MIEDLVITIHRGSEQQEKLLNFDNSRDDNFLWGFTKDDGISITVGDAESDDLEVLSSIVEMLSIAKKKAEEEFNEALESKDYHE